MIEISLVQVFMHILLSVWTGIFLGGVFAFVFFYKERKKTLKELDEKTAAIYQIYRDWEKLDNIIKMEDDETHEYKINSEGNKVVYESDIC